MTPDTLRARDGQAPRTVLVARAADRDPDTTEIRALAATAGHDVVDSLTQRRREDPTYGVGRGVAETVARRVTALDADAIVYDGTLSPGQTFSLGDLLPNGVTVLDRPRLVLRLIAAASDSRATTLRCELATRRYELPRLREVLGRDGRARRLRPEGAGRERDLERQIERLEADLEACTSTATATRDDGRASTTGDAPTDDGPTGDDPGGAPTGDGPTDDGADPGPSRVAVVGYANTGKSLLSHRLGAWDEPRSDTTQSDRLAAATRPDEPSATDDHDDHAGIDSDAVTDQPLATAGTSTTTTTLAGRRLRLTDTTGIVAGLPTEVLGAFDQTRATAREAAVTLLVIDARKDLPERERRLTAVLEVLEGHCHDVIPVLTHIDQLGSHHGVEEPTEMTDTSDSGATDTSDPDATDTSDPSATDTSDLGATETGTADLVASRAAAIADELSASGLKLWCAPLPVDTRHGTGLDAVVSALVDALPTATETLTVAYGDNTQTTLSWAYDRNLVTEVSYGQDGIDVSLAGRPAAVAAAVRRFEQ